MHTADHLLLFSFGSLLLPVVGLNKMGPKRGEGGVLQSSTVFPGSTLFARNVTVAKSSRATAMRNRPSRWRMDRLVCVLNSSWCRCIEQHIKCCWSIVNLNALRGEERVRERRKMEEGGCVFVVFNKQTYLQPVQVLMEKSILRSVALVSRSIEYALGLSM